MKITDLDKKNKEELEGLLDSASSQIGIDAWEKSNPMDIPSNFGICSTCKKIHYCRTEFDNVYVFCSYFEFKLSGKDKMIECNCYDKRGIMDLNDMKEIAIIIELDKRKAGF